MVTYCRLLRQGQPCCTVANAAIAPSLTDAKTYDGCEVSATYADFPDVLSEKRRETLPLHYNTDHAIEIEMKPRTKLLRPAKSLPPYDTNTAPETTPETRLETR